ncbi:MAG: hypothetical protein RL637_62 [Pseudomonadota bacterium]|jgi:6-pyruvoyl-tetrahydropterin synthase
MDFNQLLNQAKKQVSSNLDHLAHEMIKANLPKIQELFKQQAAHSLAAAVNDDAKMTALSQTVYQSLPTAVKTAVSLSAFTQFCLQYRHSLLPLIK